MRRLGMIQFALLFGAVTVASLPSFAGTSSGGGGDLILIRGRTIETVRSKPSSFRLNHVRRYLRSQLKSDLVRWVDTLKAEEVIELTGGMGPNFEKVKSVLLNDRARFVRDIWASAYVLSDAPVFPECGPVEDRKNEKDAATCGNKGDIVTFNVQRIARYRLPWTKYTLAPIEHGELGLKTSLIQLAFHEHVRHFGAPDNESKLGRRAQIAGTSDPRKRLEALKHCDKMIPLIDASDRDLVSDLFNRVQDVIAQCNSVQAGSVNFRTLVNRNCYYSGALGVQANRKDVKFVLPTIHNLALDASLNHVKKTLWARRQADELDAYSMVMALMIAVKTECSTY